MRFCLHMVGLSVPLEWTCRSRIARLKSKCVCCFQSILGSLQDAVPFYIPISTCANTSFPTASPTAWILQLSNFCQLYATTCLWTSLGSVSYAKGHILCLFNMTACIFCLSFTRFGGLIFLECFAYVYVYIYVYVCEDQRVVWGVFPQVLPGSSFVF